MKNYLIHKRLLAVPDRFRPHLDSSVAHSFRHKSICRKLCATDESK